MASFAPIDYGPQTSPDLLGVQSALSANERVGAQRQQAVQDISGAATQLGNNLAQNALHRQALEATATAAKGTEEALNVIENNPYYITKDELAKHIPGEQVDQLWQAAKAKNLVTTDKDGNEFAATFAVGRDLYATMTKMSREQAAEGLTLPGWRAEFLKTAETEALAKQERHVDPVLGRYATEYDKAKSMQAFRTIADQARTPEEFGMIFSGIKTSPSFSYDEKVALYHHYGKLQDTVIADKALTNPIANEETLKAELTKLQGPHAGELYPNSDAKERLELEQQVQGGLHFVQSQKLHQDEMQKKADKERDDNLNASMMRGILTGNIRADNIFAKPGQPGTGVGDQTLSQLKTREGVENFYHFVESYNKNAQEAAKVDKPGVFQAVSTLYAKDTDGFRQAFESKGAVRIPGWENLGPVNLATDLSPESYKHWAEKYTGLADKEQAKEDSANEGRYQVRLGAAITNEDGGRVKASDWSNPVWRSEHTDMEEFVAGQLKEAQVTSLRKTGHKLSVGEEYKAMLLAAKSYADNPTPGKVWGRNETEGLGFELKTGDVHKLGSLERTYMTTARRASGEVGTMDIQREGSEFYDSYKPLIETAWTKVFGKAPDLEDSWNLYYLARNLPGTGDPSVRTLTAVDLAAKMSAGKKNGGTR